MSRTYGLLLACLAAALVLPTRTLAQQPDEEVANLTFKIADALYERGNALLKKKAYDRAISDYTEAIAFYPQPFAGAYVGRGSAYEEKKDYFKAINDFARATQLDAKLPHGFNNLAWLLATCPDAKFRDGKKAVELSKKACELTGHKDGAKLDTLAAAYAESGQFKEAVTWQTKSLEMAAKESQDERRARLELYKSGKAYHGK